MPRTSRPTTVFPIALRELEVARVEDITPGMCRVTLTGDALDAHTTAEGYAVRAFTSPGFDDSLRLFFAYPGESEPVLPTQADGHLDYPKDPRPLSKVYTVRRYDPQARELTVDFVRHGIGVATTWALRAQAGDRIHVGGPAASLGMPVDFDWWLVAGDDTAIPAIGRLLDEAPEDLRAQVFIEVGDDSHRQQLRELPGVTVTWLSRDGAEPATTTQLLDAIKAADWWDGEAFAWLAGETAVIRDTRRHLIEERGVDKTAIDFTGYWKRSEVVALEGDAAVPDLDKNTPAYEKFHDLAEIVPPIAIRVAAGLRLGDLISRGVTTTPELAAQTGSDERALGKLLRYLQAIELLDQPEPGRYALTETGEFLAMDFWAEYLDPNGPDEILGAGLFGLAESVRTGRAAYASVTGREFSQVRADQEFQDKYLDDIASFADYLSAPLATSGALDGARHVVIHSDSAGVDAREITAAHPDAQITIAALPAQADWLRRDLPATIADEARRSRVQIVEQSVFEPSPASDTVLINSALTGMPDADATHALRRAAANLADGGRILLLDNTFDLDDLDEHDGEADLAALTREGGGLRTAAELETVIADAGLVISGTRRIGWGATLRELQPVGE